MVAEFLLAVFMLTVVFVACDITLHVEQRLIQKQEHEV